MSIVPPVVARWEKSENTHTISARLRTEGGENISFIFRCPNEGECLFLLRGMIDHWFHEERILDTSKPNPHDVPYLDYIKKTPERIHEWKYLDSAGLLHEERNLKVMDIFSETSDMYTMSRYSKTKIVLTMGELVWG